MAKRDVGSSLSVQRCMQCGVGGNKKLVRQLRKPQTIKQKEKDISYRSLHCKEKTKNKQTNTQTNKTLVRQVRKPQTIKEGKRKRIHPSSVQTCGT